MTEGIYKAMFMELASLIAPRHQARVRHTVYKGSKSCTVDGWLLLMNRLLERVHENFTKLDKAWTIINHLEGEARNYLINKSEPERDNPDKECTLLASRFGTKGIRMQVRQTFMARIQHEKEDWKQYLDALEGLRTQGFPEAPITTRHNEIIQLFTDACDIQSCDRNKL